MNTLNYIGCKNKLFPILYSIFDENIPNLSEKSFSDLFMGTGIVSYQMLDRCDRVFSNDLENYSYTIGYALLKCNYSDRLRELIDSCNQLDPVEGLIYKYYSPHDDCERMFFTIDNAKKADAIRIHLSDLLTTKQISLEEYHFLLASLLVSIDKVANTTCVYGAYLKKFKASALKNMILEPIHKKKDIKVEKNLMSKGFAEHTDYKSDVTYLDPPYNQRSYSGNYFVLNYITDYNADIIPKGKTGTIDRNQSGFCSKTKIKKAFTDLLHNITSTYILLSYNNEGLLSEEELRELLSKLGSVKLYKIKYNKFKAQKNVDGDHVYEYLWVIDTSKPEAFEVIQR